MEQETHKSLVRKYLEWERGSEFKSDAYYLGYLHGTIERLVIFAIVFYMVGMAIFYPDLVFWG